VNYQDDLVRYGFGFWVRASGEFIGFTGLGVVDEEMPFSGVEVAWWLARPGVGSRFTPPRQGGRGASPAGVASKVEGNERQLGPLIPRASTESRFEHRLEGSPGAAMPGCGGRQRG